MDMEPEIVKLKVKVKSALVKVTNLFSQDAKPITTAEYSDMYSTIHKMCTRRPSKHSSQQVFDLYKSLFEDYIQGDVIPNICGSHGETMVKEFVKAWTIHGVMVHWMSRLFDYLEKYLIGEMFLPSLKTIGCGFFYDLVYTRVHASIKGALLSQIHQEREGKQIERALVNDTLRVFVEMGIMYKDEVYVHTQMDFIGAYKAHFETFFLEEASTYYAQKASEWIDKYPCHDYLRKVEHCLRREDKRVGSYLHSSTKEKLLKILKDELVHVHILKLTEMAYSCWYDLQNNAKFDDLQIVLMFLINHSIELQPIGTMFEKYVLEKGGFIFKQADDASMTSTIIGPKFIGTKQKQFVQGVIDLYEVQLYHIEAQFMDHSVFHASLKKAFSILCNKDVGGLKFGKHLVRYCHDFLKKKKRSKEDMERLVEEIMHMFACVNDKEVFGDLYGKRLAQRLLFEKYATLDNERAFIAELKKVCGRSFTSMMEGMIKDVTMVQDHRKEFRKHVSKKRKFMHGIRFNVTIHRSDRWPSYNPFKIALPKEIMQCVEVFKEFYTTKIKKRKLTWVDSAGSCVMRAYFDARALDLEVAAHQAALLLLFNDTHRLSYEEIKSQLNASDEEVYGMVHISCGKHKILKKDPSNKVVAKSDICEFNNTFVVEKARQIKIAWRPAPEKKKESSKVVVDRRFAADACIIRIMKMRKIMTYQDLEKECFERCNTFEVEKALIKGQVESLIDKEYLERDSGNNNVFHYVA